MKFMMTLTLPLAGAFFWPAALPRGLGTGTSLADVSMGSITTADVALGFLVTAFRAGFLAFLPPPGPFALAFSCCFRLSASSFASLLSCS
ncbi:hypothetical protein HanXRQr2_Chr01g0025731 [Helianthus annuus]|uniref:Uncharacterized protein n=1 Tax=Helianthus annuus TaxID=4232 RepID=A0A9K3JVE0_HELAN|nr:hypothetical protein HanXRQr2_Chr01g0025731 [Helianthus annuus]